MKNFIKLRSITLFQLKFDLKMKLTIYLFIVTLFQIQASSYSQNTKITLELQDVSVEQVLREIESLTEFKFLYNDKEVDYKRKLNVKFKKENISNILKYIFANSPISYEILDKQIILKPVLTDPSVSVSNNRKITQEIEITGKVIDLDGIPLPDVNIIIVGTTVGTQTDFDGNFKINASKGDVLEFSYLGMLSVKTIISESRIINVTLLEDENSLDEVVVTALGIKKAAKALSYSVTEVSGEAVSETKELNVGNALRGQIAGVDVSSIGNGIAGSTKIRIRGNSSLTRSNEPLYVINGVPMVNDIDGTWGDGLTSINSNDIESMSVLKGSAASALYGSRASNGVILITTKKGKSRRGVGVEFNSSFLMDNIIDVFDERQIEYGVGLGGNKSTDFGFETHRAWGSKYDGSSGEYPNGDPAIYEYKENHYDQFFKTGSTFINDIAVTGGNDKSNYRLSISDFRQNGIVPNSEMRRNTIALSSNNQITKNFSINANLQYSNQEVENRPDLYYIGWGLLAMPTMWEIDHFRGTTGKIGAKENGTMYNFSTNDWILNPWWAAYQNERKDMKDRVIGSANAKYDITDWLYIMGRIGTDFTTTRFTDIKGYGARTATQSRGSVAEWTRNVRETNMDYMIGADKKLENFGFEGMFGGSTMRRTFEETGSRGDELNIPFYHVIQNASNVQPIFNYAAQGINSIYGSAEVSFKDMIYINATGRNDWFSTLAPENNSIFYASVGASFLFTEAINFPDWFNFGKIRASWGQTGGGADTPYQTQFSYGINSQGHLGVPLASIPGTLPNQFLQPYLTTEIELGLDVRLFNNRVSLDYAYYTKDTKNDISNISLTPSSGYSNAIVNLGELKTWGHEILLNVTPIKKELIWDFSIAYAYNMSEVVDTGSESGEVTVGSSAGVVTIKQIEGQPYAAIVGYDQKVIDGQKVWKWEAGRSVWAPEKTDKQVILGYGFHPHTVSFQNSLKWNNFRFDFMIEGKFGGSVFSETNKLMTARGHHTRTLVGRDNGLTLEGVKVDGSPDTPLFVESSNLENYYRRVWAEQIGAQNVYDASYLKLRQVSLGYNIPTSALSTSPINSMNISIIGRNLFNIIDHLDNADPANAYTTSGNNQGISSFPIPTTTTWGLNLKLIF